MWPFKKKKSFRLFNSKEEVFKTIEDKKAIPIDLDGEKFCIARNGNSVYCFEDKCPHQSVPLHTGSFNNEEKFQCKYHGLCINTSNGKFDFESQSGKIKMHQVKLDASGIEIILS